MSRILQLRRGNSAEHENFTGQIGEITMDTDSKSLRIHDGETPGGTPMARRDEIPDLTPFDYVVEWQICPQQKTIIHGTGNINQVGLKWAAK